MAKLPKWNNDAAMLAWIGPLIPEPPLGTLFMPLHKWHPPFTEENREREAVAAAKQGNFKLLGHLLLQPDYSPYRPPRLSIEAEQLVAARLLEKFKGRKRRPKQTPAQRRANNPVHNAADEVPTIEKILRQYFPRQRGHRGRAIELAAARAGIFCETLAQHLAHPGVEFRDAAKSDLTPV